MKEIDEMLDRWIANTIIKKQLRKLDKAKQIQMTQKKLLQV